MRLQLEWKAVGRPWSCEKVSKKLAEMTILFLLFEVRRRASEFYCRFSGRIGSAVLNRGVFAVQSASGYALFERVKSEEIGLKLDEVQKSVTDLKRFSALVKLKGMFRISLRSRSARVLTPCSPAALHCTAFLPFTSAESALENINKVSEGLSKIA
jgi:hypothetical protein